MTDVTRILIAIDEGDPLAAEQLLPLVYDELRSLANARLAREKPGQTLQATALVHEAYLRLVDVETPQHWNGRGHFFGAAAEAMRRILIECARRRQAAKRGGNSQRKRLSSCEDVLLASVDIDKLLTLDEILIRFEEQAPQQAALVKLRYFVGMTNRQAADALGISITTADRYWAYARAWLQREMGPQND